MLLQILFLKETRLLFVFWTNGCRIITTTEYCQRKQSFKRQLYTVKMVTTMNYVGFTPGGKSICGHALPWQQPLFSFRFIEKDVESLTLQHGVGNF